MTVPGVDMDVSTSTRVRALALLLLLTFAAGLFARPTPAAAGEVTAKLCPGTSVARLPAQFTDSGAGPWLHLVAGCHTAGNGVVGLYQDRDGASAGFGQGGRMMWDAPPEVSMVEVTGRVRMKDANGIRTSLVGRSGVVEEKVLGGSDLDGSVATFVWPPAGATASSLGLTISCDRSGGCPNRPDSAKAFIQMDRLEIVGRDGTPPSVDITGDVAELSLRKEWAREWPGWTAAARDSGTGVADLYFLVNGFPVATPRIACSGIIDGQAAELSPCPSARIQSGTFETSEPPFREGVNGIRACAVDFSSVAGTGNQSCTERVELRVDRRPPPPPLDLETDPGPGWTSRDRFTAGWSLPEDAGSPLSKAFYRLRSIATGQVVATDTMPSDASEGDQAREIPFPEPGSYRLEVGLIDAAGNAGATANTQVRFDDRPPPDVTPAARPGWVSRSELPLSQSVIQASGSGPSGIAGFAVTSSDLGVRPPCRGSICRLSELSWLGGPNEGQALLDGLVEGENTVSAVAVSGAMIPSRNPGVTRVRVDLTDPTVRLEGNSAEWSDRPVTLTAVSTDRLSGMAPDPMDGDVPITGVGVAGLEPQVEVGDSSSLTVTREGVTEVEYFARDLAGNSTRRNGTAVRIDSTPPSVRFSPSVDPLDPERVVALVDDEASGLADGEISIGPKGARADFRTLATTMKSDRLEALIPSDDLPPGEYVIRAEAIDGAGNREVSISSTPLRLPLKSSATLSLQVADEAGTRSPAVVGSSGAALFGRLSVSSGRLDRDALVTVEESFPPGSGLPERKTTVQVAEDGSFSIQLPAGPSRRVRATFSGDRLNGRTSSRWVSLSFTDRVRFSVRDRVTRNRVPTRMVGSVSGPGMTVPPGGKKIVIQYFDPSRRSWRPVEIVNSSQSGAFAFTYRFRTITSRQQILFRALSLGEAGWPFAPSASRPVAVIVVP